MPVITPNIPEGLIELMKTFAKCVLKEKPENIYEFSVVHFEKLLQERDGSLNKGYERFAASEKYLDAREQCLMSQITSHLNKKTRPDPLKISPNDDTANVPNSETLSPKSLQNKFRPRKLSSRKASEALLSIQEEDEGHNPSEELAIQHRKLTAARRIQRAYKSYRKRKEQKENGAALIIQRTLKKLFGSKLGSSKALQNDRESTCNNIQNDSGVESDVPKDEADESRKELNVGVKKYMDSDLAINGIITQQVPSFTEDECRSSDLKIDKGEEFSVGNLVEADTVVQKEKSVDSESSVHMGSNIESSPSKQVDTEETHLNDQSVGTEDKADVDTAKDANPKFDQDHTKDEEEVKADILKDVEEPLKTEAGEAGKSILEKEGRFVSNDTNNIGSAELVSDVHNQNGDNIENKANGFPEAILEEVARNGSKNDISKETIELVKSPRENEDGKQNTKENSNNDKNGGKKEIENDLNYDEKATSSNNGNGIKQEESEEKLFIDAVSKDDSNDIEEVQPQLSLTENGNKKGSQDNIKKEMEIETITNDEEKNKDSHENDSNKDIDVNETKHGNEENKDEYSNLSLKKDEDSVIPKSVWYVGSEPIITSKSTEEKDESKSYESINSISNEKSESEGEQENNSTINEDLKSHPESDIANSVNEKAESKGNNSEQENHDISIENNFEENQESEIEQVKPDKITTDAPNANGKTTEGSYNEISLKGIENDKNVVDESTNETKNEENTVSNHALEGEKNHIISGTTENSAEKLKSDEEKQDISEKHIEHNNDVGDGGPLEETITLEPTERNVENIKNEAEEISGKETTERNIENFKNDEKLQGISEKDTGCENILIEEDEIGTKNESGSKYAESNVDDQTISQMAEQNSENLKSELQISSADPGNEKNIKGATEMPNEENSGNQNSESYEDRKDEIITETEKNLNNIKNDEVRAEEIGKDIGSDNNNIVDKDASGTHTAEVNSSEADGEDTNINIPKTTESSTEILKNGGEKEENLNKKSSEEVTESTNGLVIEKTSQELLKNLSEEEKEADENESHITQGKPNNLEELEHEVGKEETVGETREGEGNEENTNNNKVSLNEENLPSGENKIEGAIDSKNETSSEKTEDQHGTNMNRAEVIEEEIKKVVAPLRYASPGKISVESIEENNPEGEYKSSEESDDKLIAKELLQHANVKNMDALLKGEQNKCEEQAADNEKTETEIFQAENKSDQNSLNEKTNELERKSSVSSSEDSVNNKQDDVTLESRSTESNEYNKFDENKDEENVLESETATSPKRMKEKQDEAETKKRESQLLNSEPPKLKQNEVELNEINENDNGTAENLEDKILENSKLEKSKILESNIKEDKKRKQREEGAFEGFILEPAFKDNDGGNTGIEENAKKDSTKTSEAATINEEQGAGRSQVNIPEVQITEISTPEDDKQTDTNSEDKNEVAEVPQGTEQTESCEEESNINPSKEDNKCENKSEGRKEDNICSTQAEKEMQNEDVVGPVSENSNTSDIKNSEKLDKNALIKRNEQNSIIQDPELNVHEKQMDYQKDSEVESPENNDLRTGNDLQVSDDNKKLSLCIEANEDESLSLDDEVNKKDKKNDGVESNNKQIEDKREINIAGQKTDDFESRKKVNIDAENEILPDDKLPIVDEKTEGLKEKEEEGNEQKERSLKNDGEKNVENTIEITKTSNEDDELKTSDKIELEKPIDKIELGKLNAEQKSETIKELTENENTENKDISDEEDTELSQDTVEENQFSEINKSSFQSKENSGQNVDIKVETKDSEEECNTSHSLDKAEIVDIPFEKIYEQRDISVQNSEKNSEEIKEDTADNVNKEEEKEDKRNQIKDKQDINSSEDVSFDLSQKNAENSNNQKIVIEEETKKDLDLDVGKNKENKNILELKTDETKKDLDDVDKNILKLDESKMDLVEVGKNKDETKKDLDDVDKKNENGNILGNSADKHKSIELLHEQVTLPEKENNVSSSNQEKEKLEKKSSISDNILKDVEKDEDTEKNKNEEYTDIKIEENKQLDKNVQLNRTYTISKNHLEETADNSIQNPIFKRQTSSSLLNALLNEKPADNEILPQKLTEKSEDEEIKEVQEGQITKQIIPHATTSEVQSEHLLDAENIQPQDNSENSTEKSESKETKAEANEEQSGEKLLTTSEISSAPLSDAETTRAESRSTMNDELSEIENIDISTYGEDSLEAMYYSLRKNEIMLDRMQKRASERKSASKERGPFEKLDLRQVKSMSEMGRSMSVNSDDDVVIKTLKRNKSSDNDLEELNNPIPVVAQNTARLLEAMHQINSNTPKPFSSSFDEDRVVRPPCRMYSPSIRMKSRIPTPIKDYPKSVSFETALAVAQRKSQKFMQQLHNDSQSSETLDSLLDQKETSDTIRQKMLAYSVSEADSDYCVEAEKKMRVMHDDSNVSTALETASTDTDSTIVSAATKIQAGARGFLTRRRLRRASDGALQQESERKASFGNEAIGESLDLVEQNAASTIQKSYRRYLGTKQHKSESSKPSAETSSSSKSSDSSKPVGITQVNIGQKRNRDNSDEAKKTDDIDDGYHGAYFEGLNLAERRMTLQRGDAVQIYSTPEEENGFSLTNGRQASDAGDSKPTTSPKKRKPVKSDTWRNFGLRQRTMPVQIESDILRVVPKHMRKRIKSADALKKSRQLMQ